MSQGCYTVSDCRLELTLKIMCRYQHVSEWNRFVGASGILICHLCVLPQPVWVPSACLWLPLTEKTRGHLKERWTAATQM